jgi:hypothetical protein
MYVTSEGLDPSELTKFAINDGMIPIKALNNKKIFRKKELWADK